MRAYFLTIDFTGCGFIANPALNSPRKGDGTVELFAKRRDSALFFPFLAFLSVFFLIIVQNK
jgi:hypothetical protein